MSLNAQAKDTWVRYSVNFTIGGTTEGYLAIVNPDRGTRTGFDLALPQVIPTLDFCRRRRVRRSSFFAATSSRGGNLFNGAPVLGEPGHAPPITLVRTSLVAGAPAFIGAASHSSDDGCSWSLCGQVEQRCACGWRTRQCQKCVADRSHGRGTTPRRPCDQAEKCAGRCGSHEGRAGSGLSAMREGRSPSTGQSRQCRANDACGRHCPKHF